MTQVVGQLYHIFYCPTKLVEKAILELIHVTDLHVAFQVYGIIKQGLKNFNGVKATLF